jgi:hypothetical protein
LYHTRGCNVQSNTVGDGEELGGRYSCVFGIRPEYRVGYAVANLDALSGRFIRYGGYSASTFLSADKRKITRIQTLSVIGIDKVDTGKFVLYNDLTGSHLWYWEICLHLQNISITNLTNDCSLVGYKTKNIRTFRLRNKAETRSGRIISAWIENSTSSLTFIVSGMPEKARRRTAIEGATLVEFKHNMIHA